MLTQDHETPATGVRGELHQDRFLGDQDLTRWTGPVGKFLASAVRRVSTLFGHHAALILTLCVGALIATTLTAVFSEVYESVVNADGVAGLDHPVLDAAKSVRSPGLDLVVTGYTDIGGTVGMPILAVTTAVVLSLRRRSWTPAILVVIGGAGSLLMTVAGKHLIGRMRPFLSDAVPPYEYSASFPSGHSLNSVVIAGIVAYLVLLRLTSGRARVLTVTLAAAFALTMGLSRVYLGHHWLTDVLAAWSLGLAWLALIITAHRLYLTSRKRAANSAATTFQQATTTEA
jgi:undecaprenyl-diphosphatase